MQQATTTTIDRRPHEQEYCHERLGEKFAEALSQYDTTRRVETLIDAFLTDEMVVGKRALDVGCGLGFFSQRLAQRGANVTCCDLGPSLVEQTKQKVGCDGVVADALRLVEQFGERSFDLVVSSECVEHTPDPRQAIAQMCRLLKPGGYLSLSTPNIVWSPVVKLASLLGVRPFNGYENFSSWRSIAATLRAEGVELVRQHGLHLFPFQFRLHGLSRWCDQHLQCLRGGMINICVLGRKTA